MNGILGFFSFFGGCDPRCGVSIAYDDGGNTKRDTVSHIKTPFFAPSEDGAGAACHANYKLQIWKTISLLKTGLSMTQTIPVACGKITLFSPSGVKAHPPTRGGITTSPEAHCVCVYLQPDPIFSHSLENDDGDRKPRRKILNRRQRVLQRSCSFVHSISGIGIGGGEEERDMTSSLIYVNYRKRRKERLKP